MFLIQYLRKLFDTGFPARYNISGLTILGKICSGFILFLYLHQVTLSRRRTLGKSILFLIHPLPSAPEESLSNAAFKQLLYLIIDNYKRDLN